MYFVLSNNLCIFSSKKKPDQRDSMAYSLSFAGSESDRSVVSPSLTPLQREQLANVTNMKREDSNMDRRKYETYRLDTAESDMQEKFFEFVEQVSLLGVFSYYIW